MSTPIPTPSEQYDILSCYTVEQLFSLAAWVAQKLSEMDKVPAGGAADPSSSSTEAE